MTDLAATLGILLGVLTSCTAHGQAIRAARPQNSAPAESGLAACPTRLCRLHQYAAAFQRGAVIEVPADAQSVTTRSDCAPLYWHRVTIAGASGNAFDQTTDMLWIGRNATLVTQTARAAGSTYTTNGTPHDDSAWQRLESGELAVITLQSVLTGMPAYHKMHGIDQPEPETTEMCSIVHIDSCTGRIGYVCSGSDVQKPVEADPEPQDGRYVFELELDSHATTYGLFNGEVLELER